MNKYGYTTYETLPNIITNQCETRPVYHPPWVSCDGACTDIVNTLKQIKEYPIPFLVLASKGILPLAPFGVTYLNHLALVKFNDLETKISIYCLANVVNTLFFAINCIMCFKCKHPEYRDASFGYWFMTTISIGTALGISLSSANALKD